MTAPEAFSWFLPGDPPNEGCWDWPASTTNAGYGNFTVKVGSRLVTHYAHRVSYEIFHGPIPYGLLVMHSCDRPVCVNPAHLRAGTQKENMREASVRGRI